MNAKRWSDLKSRRAVTHRAARQRKRRGELQHQRELPERMKGMSVSARPTPKPEPQAEEPKPQEKTGMMKRLYRRVTGA